MHIGKLSIVLRNGSFVVEDLVIEGLKPTDRPFLKAKRVIMNLPWWTFFTRELIVENVDMTDWEMLVEQFPGQHNFPKLGRPEEAEEARAASGSSRRPCARSSRATASSPTTTTPRRGWSCAATSTSASSRASTPIAAPRSSANGTVEDPGVRGVPRRHADALQDRRRQDRPRGHQSPEPRRVDQVTGYVDIATGRTMVYNVKSRIDFPIQKDDLSSGT